MPNKWMANSKSLEIDLLIAKRYRSWHGANNKLAAILPSGYGRMPRELVYHIQQFITFSVNTYHKACLLETCRQASFQ